MKSVLIVVFDGLQPTQVTHELMPNLFNWVQGGVTFSNNHPVFPSVTRINAATMVTGSSPGTHGLAANNMVFREYDPYSSIPVLQPQLVDIAAKSGDILKAPTLADILSLEGLEYNAIVSGTSGNAFVHNPHAGRNSGVIIHPEFTLPYDLAHNLAKRFGAWPEEALPNSPRIAHGVTILTDYILPERNPAVSLLWSSEPDKSQHAYGVGSSQSNRAIHEADQEFKNILNYLDRTGLIQDIDLFVLSDHGYSTIREVIPLERLLRESGFPTGDKPGGITVAPNGGSALFYAYGKDPSVCEQLAEWLMVQPWCGSLIKADTVGHIEGVLPASICGCEGFRTPDITMSFKWDSEQNDTGYPGFVFSTGGSRGQGTHGSMSKHELQNVLYARGPSFKSEFKSDLPSGNIDLAPTVLHILGLQAEDNMSGRVLHEGLLSDEDLNMTDWETEIHNSERVLGDLVYRQQITISKVGKTTYLEQGNNSLGHR